MSINFISLHKVEMLCVRMNVICGNKKYMEDLRQGLLHEEWTNTH
ncbi:hypothetical protein GCM10022405_41580 [Gibbsiella dentisursi]|uniref:Uncharacterized protein n=1 Tax=Gibbsiella dentisursi TaxID=796890 RepID=A0ABP7M065_9GAMM